jgi:bifunctional non-homologous end joining protein LigD
VEPDVVVEVQFVSRTDEGRLWHPVFRGIRTDKNAEDARG